MGALDGKVTLVTGASRGIGHATAIALAAEGARVAVAARNTQDIEAVAAEISGIAVACDVTSLESIEKALFLTATDLGPVEILVNNAGISSSNPIERTTDEQWDTMFDTNLRGAFYMSRAVVAGMKERRWGRIVNVASRAGRKGFAYVTAYCASKYGMVGLTQALAVELEGTGVTCNAVCPGWVDTGMARRSVENIAAKTGVTVEKGYAQIAALNRSGALLTPDGVAQGVLKLCVGNDNGQLIDME